MDVIRGYIRGACGTICRVGAVGLGWAPPSSVPTRVGCARVWWAYALGEGRASGGALIGWRLQFDTIAASWGGGCQPAGSSTAARATRWASFVTWVGRSRLSRTEPE